MIVAKSARLDLERFPELDALVRRVAREVTGTTQLRLEIVRRADGAREPWPELEARVSWSCDEVPPGIYDEKGRAC